MERFWQGGRLSCQMYHLFYPLSFHLSSSPLLHHLGHWFCALPKFIAWRCTLRIHTSLMRSCRIITLGSKLRETSDGTLPLVARSFRPMFVWAVFKSACFSQLKGDVMCLSAVCGLSVSVVLVSVIVYWEVLFGMSCVCCLECVFLSLFLGTCFVWWMACWLPMLCMFILSDFFALPTFCQQTQPKSLSLYLWDFWEIEKSTSTQTLQYKSFKWELLL